MFTRKSLVAIFLSGVMAFSMVGCTGAGKTASVANASSATAKAASGSKAKTVLKCSFNQTADNPEYKAVAKLSDELKKRTNGDYEIDISPNALLGDQQTSLELVENGSIQMAIVANSLVEDINKDFSIIGCPYMFDSQDQQKKLFESDSLKDLFATTESKGFDVVSAYSLGARSVYSTVPVKTPADLKGKKIRVMQSNTMVKMLNLMGGIGTAMSQGDVYSAVQAHTIDGAENNIITFTELKHYEVCKYYSFTNHLMIPDLLVINHSVYKNMPQKDQAIFNNLAKESVENMFSLMDEETAKCKKEDEAHGVKFNSVDITPFKENCKPLINECANRDASTKKIYADVQKIKA